MLSWINKPMLLLAGSSGLKDNGICSVLCVIFLFYFLAHLFIPGFMILSCVSREFFKSLGQWPQFTSLHFLMLRVKVFRRVIWRDKVEATEIVAS